MGSNNLKYLKVWILFGLLWISSCIPAKIVIGVHVIWKGRKNISIWSNRTIQIPTYRVQRLDLWHLRLLQHLERADWSLQCTYHIPKLNKKTTDLNKNHADWTRPYEIMMGHRPPTLVDPSSPLRNIKCTCEKAD